MNLYKPGSSLGEISKGLKEAHSSVQTKVCKYKRRSHHTTQEEDTFCILEMDDINQSQNNSKGLHDDVGGNGYKSNYITIKQT